MLSSLVAVLILLPLVIYLVAAFKAPKESHDPDTFFLAPNQISSTEFANTSVAYGFQIASVSVFVAWGYFYGLGAIVNPFFWGVGILLFALSLRRVRPFLGTRQTLHGFLGSRYGSRTLTVLASLMTLVGFLGAFTAELVWGSYALSLISESEIFIYSMTTAMGLFLVFYLARRGSVSVMQTDQYQLLFAHAGFLITGVAVLTWLHQRGPEATAVGLLLSCALAVILTVILTSIRRQRKLDQMSTDDSSPEGSSVGVRATIGLEILVLLALLGAVANLLFFLPAAAALPQLAGQRHLYDFSQGKLNLLSLALLPLCWQFFDVTNWQRIGAVRVRRTPEGEPDLRPIRLGLLRMAWESPASWVFAILLGVALRYAAIGIDEESVWLALGELPQVLASGATPFGLYLGSFLGILFAAGVVAVMLSSADSMLMGSTFTLVYDLIPAVKKTSSDRFLYGNPERAIRVGKFAALAMMLGGLVAYWISALMGFDLLALLFGAFSAQVSLTPAVLGTLFLRERAPSAPWAIASVIAGFLGGMGMTVAALQNPDWQLYPPLATLALSIPIFLVGIAVNSQRRTA